MIDYFQCSQGIWALQPPKNGKKYPVDVAETSTPILNDLHGAIVLYCRSRLVLSILSDLYLAYRFHYDISSCILARDPRVWIDLEKTTTPYDTVRMLLSAQIVSNTHHASHMFQHTP